jgi:hypothetical protein
MLRELPTIIFAAASGLLGDSGNPQMAREEYRQRKLANRILSLGVPSPRR